MNNNKSNKNKSGTVKQKSQTIKGRFTEQEIQVLEPIKRIREVTEAIGAEEESTGTRKALSSARDQAMEEAIGVFIQSVRAGTEISAPVLQEYYSGITEGYKSRLAEYQLVLQGELDYSSEGAFYRDPEKLKEGIQEMERWMEFCEEMLGEIAGGTSSQDLTKREFRKRTQVVNVNQAIRDHDVDTLIGYIHSQVGAMHGIICDFAVALEPDEKCYKAELRDSGEMMLAWVLTQCEENKVPVPPWALRMGWHGVAMSNFSRILECMEILEIGKPSNHYHAVGQDVDIQQLLDESKSQFNELGKHTGVELACFQGAIAHTPEDDLTATRANNN